MSIASETLPISSISCGFRAVVSTDCTVGIKGLQCACQNCKLCRVSVAAVVEGGHCECGGGCECESCEGVSLVKV